MPSASFPCPFGFLTCHRLDSGDDVLKLGDGSERTPCRQSIMLGHVQDERALVRLQAFKESV